MRSAIRALASNLPAMSGEEFEHLWQAVLQERRERSFAEAEAAYEAGDRHAEAGATVRWIRAVEGDLIEDWITERAQEDGSGLTHDTRDHLLVGLRAWRRG